MKFAVIIILLVSIEAQAQTIADIARAERKRREALKSKIELQEFGTAPAVAPPTPVPEAEPAKEEAKAEESEESSVAEQLQEQRVDLIKTRAQLLVKLDQVKDDPEQVKAIEQELIGLTKIAESLKLQHLAEAAKTQP